MQRLLTGIQSSGALHIGNYLGALKPFAEMYERFESFLMVADYHALTTGHLQRNPDKVRENSLNVVKDYIAAGVDPAKAVIFQQSQVQEHTELAWILECLIPLSLLELAHAFKDKLSKGLEANAGLFNYPMLMAADILLYDTGVVPVGADQRQHVEYAREAAAKFNNTYGKTFKEPRESIPETVATIPGTDGKKMSKSYGNTIPLFGAKDEIAKAVMSIVTDSTGERPEHVYAIHKYFSLESDLTTIYSSNRGNYKALKEALVEDIEKMVAPMRARRNQISDDDVRRILKEGSDKARAIASAKMAAVRKLVGVAL